MTRAQHLLAICSLSCGALFSSTAALAQDDAAAGLFTDARQLPLVSQAISVTVDGDEALLHLTQVFANEGQRLGQADYNLHLPEGAGVEGFGFWTGDRFLTAELQARDEARAAHTEAASEGRATAIMDREGSIHSFSVYPVEAGSLKQVETTIRLPIAVEGGRREVLVPVDRFLDQGGATSTVTARVKLDRPLAELGLSTQGRGEVSWTTLQREEDRALVATTTREPLVLHWHEEAPPIDIAAWTIDTPDGTGLALRVGLNDAGIERQDLGRIVVIADGSHSMRRRRAAVEAVLQRIEGVSSAPVYTRTAFPDGAQTGLTRDTGGSLTWADLEASITDEDCSDSDIRCVVITDAQLPGIAGAETSPAELIVLADAHEAAFFADQLPPGVSVHQPGVDPRAHLAALVDEAVLPVLEVHALRIGDTSVVPLGDGPWRVAEGGLLRVHAFADVPEGAVLELEGMLGDTPLSRSLPLEDAGDASARLRRALYRDQLADWMSGWKDQPDETLKTRITELSLREGIPTAFTSLQVDDPALSLVSIKPGDPILTVDGGPGVTDIVAWYPFGETRRLVAEGNTWTDRFLVPRAWPEKAYRVDTFSRNADGSVAQKGVWYVLDEQAPAAQVSVDGARLVIDTGEQTPDIGAVELHAAGAIRALALDAEGAQSWSSELDGLPQDFTIVVRDRAGNVTRLASHKSPQGLVVASAPRDQVDAPVLPLDSVAIDTAEGPMRVDGTDAIVHLADRSLRFSTKGLHLRSLRLTAALDLGDRLLLGTQGGDLLSVTCDGECVAERVQTDLPEHPVSGLVETADGTVLVSILGAGLFELTGGRITPSGLRVGSRFVTGLAAADNGDLLIGTAYNGLWRMSSGRGQALRTRFAHEHVAGLKAPGDLLAADPVRALTVLSGHGRFVRQGRDRFAYEAPGLNGIDVGADDLVDLARVGDTTWIAGFDSGLWRLGPEGEQVQVGLDLRPNEARINALAVFGERLWLATEGGVLSLDPDRPEHGVKRELAGAAHDFSVGPQGLAVASSAGLFVVGDAVRRVDVEGPLTDATVGSGRYISVAWHGDDLYAGSMDGLLHLDADATGWQAVPVTAADGFAANWVTALLSDGEQLFVGTYADGLWALSEDGIGPVSALADQWIPPHALGRIGDALWVGGIGMAAARLGPDGQASALSLPVRDVNAMLPGIDGGVLVATSDGLVKVRQEPLVVR